MVDLTDNERVVYQNHFTGTRTKKYNEALSNNQPLSNSSFMSQCTDNEPDISNSFKQPQGSAARGKPQGNSCQKQNHPSTSHNDNIANGSLNLKQNSSFQITPEFIKDTFKECLKAVLSESLDLATICNNQTDIDKNETTSKEKDNTSIHVQDTGARHSVTRDTQTTEYNLSGEENMKNFIKDFLKMVANQTGVRENRPVFHCKT